MPDDILGYAGQGIPVRSPEGLIYQGVTSVMSSRGFCKNIKLAEIRSPESACKYAWSFTKVFLQEALFAEGILRCPFYGQCEFPKDYRGLLAVDNPA